MGVYIALELMLRHLSRVSSVQALLLRAPSSRILQILDRTPLKGARQSFQSLKHIRITPGILINTHVWWLQRMVEYWREEVCEQWVCTGVGPGWKMITLSMRSEKLQSEREEEADGAEEAHK